MDSHTLQMLGIATLAAGLVFGGIGAHRIALNLPVSHEEALAEAERALTPEGEGTERRTGEALRDTLEIQVWESATEARNAIRTKARVEGSVLLVLGIIGIVWGIAMLYYGGNTPGGG